MADVDIDPFGKHESRPEEPTNEHIPLDPVTPVGGGGSTWDPSGVPGPWEPTHEQQTSFRGRLTPLCGGRQSQRNRLLINWVERLSQKMARTSEVFHYNLFELRDGKLYFRDKSKPLTTKKGGLNQLKR